MKSYKQTDYVNLATPKKEKMNQQVNCMPVKPAPYDASYMINPGFTAGGPQPIMPKSANYGTGKK
jgi:hypothetical protein